MGRRPALSSKWILLAATGLGVFSTLMAGQLTARMAEKPSWPHLATLNFGYWYTWALFTPAIVWLAGRYRFERGRWTQAVPVHLAGVVLFTTGHVGIMTTLRWWLLRDAPKGYPWVDGFWLTLIQFLDWEMMTYWAIVGLSLALTYYRESRARSLEASQLETRLVEAQLQTLQRQLQPHFLFNTLHAISALMHKDVDQADRMLSRLSELLRLTLEKVGVAEVRLKDEIEFLEKYLQIEQTRFQDRLSVSFDVQPETLDAWCRRSCCSRSSRTRSSTASRRARGPAASTSARATTGSGCTSRCTTTATGSRWTRWPRCRRGSACRTRTRASGTTSGSTTASSSAASRAA